MTSVLVKDCVEVQVPASLVADTAIRPAPRRDPELVALRAELLGLTPYAPPEPVTRYWLIPIILGLAVVYLLLGLGVL